MLQTVMLQNHVMEQLRYQMLDILPVVSEPELFSGGYHLYDIDIYDNEQYMSQKFPVEIKTSLSQISEK